MTRRRPRPPQFPNGAADVARRFGVTVKALRLYETAGLISPVRDSHGWRTYGQVECERLHLVLLLRRLGLSIARIGDMLAAGEPDLAAVLDLQARALEEQRLQIDRALELIDRARRHLGKHGSIDSASLAALASAEPMRLRWTPALEKLAARCFTQDQQRRLAEVAPAIESEWQAVYHELAEIVDGPADTARARQLGTQAASLIGRMTDGDPAMRGALTRFWQNGFADPSIARTLPLDERGWRFLGLAMASADDEER